MGKKSLVLIFMVILVLRPVLSILDGIIDIVGLISVFLMLLVLLIINHILSKKSILDYVFFLLYLLTWVTEIYIYGNYTQSLDHGLKILLVIEMILFLSENENILLLKSLMQAFWVRILLTLQLFVISSVFSIQMIKGDGYEQVWGDKYFVSILSSAHVLSYLLILLMLICLYLYTVNARPYFIIILGYLIVVQQFTGVRAIFIALIFLVGLTFFYVSKCLKKWKFILLIALLSGIIAYIIISGLWVEIPMAKKMIYRVDTETVDGGRTTFWLQNLIAYSEFSFPEKLIGKSFLFPYQINLQDSGLFIWSHNDFINILLSIGVFGLIAYVYFYVKYFICLIQNNSMLPSMLSIVFLVSIPLLNGLYNYPDMAFALTFLTLIFFRNNNQAQNLSKVEGVMIESQQEGTFAM